MRLTRPPRAIAAIAVVLLVTLYVPLSALAASLVQINSDPFTNPFPSQHRTQVEPDTFAFGSTIVAAFQSGRFFDGGSSDIGWATSTDGGTTWARGFLPGTTAYATPPGPFARVSDPSVAYDARHNVWMIASLPINAAINGVGVIVNRSTNGGTTWGNPVAVVGQLGTDKDWIACDNTPTSPFYGHCYVEWDLNSFGNLIFMSTSTDGGLTWGPARLTANFAAGIGGQPVVARSGLVVVPMDDAVEGSLQVFFSLNGGASWTRTYTIAQIFTAPDAGGIRSGPLPSAEVDAAGKVYIVWEDCRFEPVCATNDLVMQTIGGSPFVTAVTRIPIDPIGSGVDHFIPGLAVDPATSGSGAHLALTYYYYPRANCTVSTCQLDVGFVSSTDGGAHWSAPQQLAGPMNDAWLANTDQGVMVGDYISTSFEGGTAHPVFAVAQAPSGGVFNEAMYSVPGGLTPSAGTLTSSGEQPIAGAHSGRAVATAPLKQQ